MSTPKSVAMKHWMLDKRIPPGLLLAICMQMIAIIIWAVQLDGRVFTLENHLGSAALVQERVGRIEERLQSVKEDVQSTRRLVEQLTQHLMRNN